MCTKLYDISSFYSILSIEYTVVGVIVGPRIYKGQKVKGEGEDNEVGEMGLRDEQGDGYRFGFGVCAVIGRSLYYFLLYTYIVGYTADGIIDMNDIDKYLGYIQCSNLSFNPTPYP